MKLFLVSGSFALLFSFSAIAQANNDTIIWSPRRLAWTDFREVVAYDKYYRKLAKTRWFINYHEADDVVKNVKRITVSATFICNHSWVRKSSLNNYVLLAHEQLHFDIAEIFARRLRKELSTLQPGEVSIRQIEKIKTRLFNKLHRMQADYDADTAGGNKADRQKWWYDFSVQSLQQLQSFAGSEIIISLR